MSKFNGVTIILFIVGFLTWNTAAAHGVVDELLGITRSYPSAMACDEQSYIEDIVDTLLSKGVEAHATTYQKYAHNSKRQW